MQCGLVNHNYRMSSGYTERVLNLEYGQDMGVGDLRKSSPKEMRHAEVAGVRQTRCEGRQTTHRMR